MHNRTRHGLAPVDEASREVAVSAARTRHVLCSRWVAVVPRRAIGVGAAVAIGLLGITAMARIAAPQFGGAHAGAGNPSGGGGIAIRNAIYFDECPDRCP